MPKKEFEVYLHHDIPMWVRKDLKGQHRDHGLCHSCAWFKPENREQNCKIANALYRFDILANVTTPVWECAEFQEAK